MDDSALDPPPAARCPADAPRQPPGLRAWFLGFLLWLSGLALVFQLALAGYEAGDPLARGLCLLAGMCFYVSLCNFFLPLPTAWVVMLLSCPAVELFQPAWLRVLVVSSAAAAATMIANLNEYHLLLYLLRFGLARRLRRWRIYRRGAAWFDVAPFRTLLLVAFLPLPIDALRWLAVLRGYPRLRFGLAYLLGRWPRYALLAGATVGLGLDAAQIIAVQLGLVLALAAQLAFSALRRPARRSGALALAAAAETAPRRARSG